MATYDFFKPTQTHTKCLIYAYSSRLIFITHTLSLVGLKCAINDYHAEKKSHHNLLRLQINQQTQAHCNDSHYDMWDKCMGIR